MHQRSTAPRSRRWVGGILSLLLMSGCFPAPTKAPTGSKASGTLVAGKPVASPSDGSSPSEVPVQRPSVPTLPIEVKAPIISHNGGNVIHGTVMAPAKIISHNGGNIIGNNGGNIISHNGGNVVSNGGGNIISHNGGNLKISQVPLANAVVRLKDAAGKPVKDDQGNELVTKTDENGGYKFPVDVKGRNLVVHAEVPGQTSDLVALLPKDGVAAGGSVAVDMASTLTLSYILELYVKGDLATFEKLPKDLENKARVQTEEAIVKGAIAVPETLEREELIAVVTTAIEADSAVEATFREIKELLVIAGIINEGDGMPGTEIPVSTIDAVISDGRGAFYTFSRSRHTLWKVEENGIAKTLVPQGKWGYADSNTDVAGHSAISGIAFDMDGSLILADTDFNRIVRIARDNTVKVIAGTGQPGFSGDGGIASKANLNKPTGLVVLKDGSLLFADSLNNRIRKIRLNGTIETVAGINPSSEAQSVQTLQSARFSNPQGLALLPNGDVLVADFGHNSLRKISGNSVNAVGNIGQFRNPISLAVKDGLPYLLCLNSGVYTMSDGIRLVNADDINGVKLRHQLTRMRLIAATTNGFIFEDFGSLFGWSGGENISHLFGRLLTTPPPVGDLVLAYGLCSIEDDIYVADTGQNRVLKLSKDGKLLPYIGNGSKGQYVAESSELDSIPLSFPYNLSKSKDGGLLITSIGEFPVVRELSTTGQLKTIIGNGEFSNDAPMFGEATKIPLNGNPYHAVQLENGEVVFDLSDRRKLMKLGLDGKVTQMFEDIDLGSPQSLTLDEIGRLNFLDRLSGRIYLVEDGKLVPRLEKIVFSPEVDLGVYFEDMDFDKFGNLFVATKNQVLKMDISGRKTVVAGVNGLVLNGATKDTGLLNIVELEVTDAGDLYILEPEFLKKVDATVVYGQ